MEMAPGMGMSLLKNGVMGGITVTQPLFSGGQIINGNRLAAVGTEVSKIQKEQNENEVSLTVEQYYWQVVMLQEKLATLTAVATQLDRISKDVAAAVDADVTMRNDLLQVQLKRNDVRISRISLENGLSVCRMMLAQYIGRNGTIQVDSRISLEEMPDFPNHLFAEPERAFTKTTGYRLLEENVKASHLQQRIAVGKNLPQIAVGAGYMYDNLMDKSHPFAIGYVSVPLPLSDWWSGTHAVRKQKLQVMNAENQLSDTSELLMIGMNKAWNDLKEAYEQILVARSSVEQSTENLRLNENYYRAGTTTMSDLLEAQTLYRQSRDRYVEAYTQFRIKTVEYLQATGR